MKKERNILIAFLLNLMFSLFEFLGGMVIGSVAISSDAVHDLGDAASIGISYLLEKKSKKKADEKYTYGYSRYSVIGGLITSAFLLIGSAVMIFRAVERCIKPRAINYDVMIIFAILGVCVNLCAAVFTHGHGSVNQRAVNLHMIEDVLGWIVVLIGAVVMYFTGLTVIDAILSVCVSLYIAVNTVANLKNAMGPLLEKAPSGIDSSGVKSSIESIDGVLDAHHIHVWSLDGINNVATVHVVTVSEPSKIKGEIREKLKTLGIGHVTVETETVSEHCRESCCRMEIEKHCGHFCQHS